MNSKEKFPDDDDENWEIPPEIVQLAEKYSGKLLPKKSKAKYDNCFTNFEKWCESKNVRNIDESVMIAFFGQLCEKFAASTVWSQYSMIKASLIAKRDIDISKYKRLTAMLKQNSVGYKPKKAKILTAREVETFLANAPDEIHLITKVNLVMST